MAFSSTAVGQKGSQLLNQRARLTRHDELKILPQGLEKLVLAEEVRERHQGEDQQRHEREQGVVGDRACEQDALVSAKAFEHGKRERAWVLEHRRGSATQASHGEPWFERS